MPVISFAAALTETETEKRHLLLGNGFSMALFHDRFSYRSLLEEADFAHAPEARIAFDRLKTTDFELVIEALRQAVVLAPVYGVQPDTEERMRADAEALKELLVRAIAGKHPERPSEITQAQYGACREFLGHFVGEHRAKTRDASDRRGCVFTLNYDLLLYWTLLHRQVINWDAADPLSATLSESEALLHDDGFRAPEDDPEAAYVTWDAEGATSQNIHFLHGGLHLFDYGAELQKKCWERSGGLPLVDQIRDALHLDKFPLFVAEGKTSDKLKRIRHNGYLQRSLRSFTGYCRAKSTIFIYGHSLAANDEHVLSKLEKGKFSKLYVSVYGDPETAANRAVIQRASRMSEVRSERYPLQVRFYDAESAKVWG